MSKILELAKRIASTGGLETKTTETISGTYDSTGQQRLLSHAYTIGANLTITNGELILSRLADNGTSMTLEFGSDVTLTGDGTLMLGDLGQGQQNFDASKLTGVIGSGVTIPAAGVTGTLGSGVTFPAGHIINHWNKSFTLTSSATYTLTGTMAKITFGGSNDFEITGITATHNNWLWMTCQAGGYRQTNIDGYYAQMGFRIDTSTTPPASDFMCAYYNNQGTGSNASTPASSATWSALIPVPASYSNKTAHVICAMQESALNYNIKGNIYAGPVNTDMSPDNIPWRLSFNIFEIKG